MERLKIKLRWFKDNNSKLSHKILVLLGLRYSPTLNLKLKIYDALNNIEERIKVQKENGCTLLKCKTIDSNIQLRVEIIELKKIVNCLEDCLVGEILENENLGINDANWLKQKIDDWVRNEVANE